MKVYVVLAWWDNDEDEGRDVLGVYADRDDARKAMNENADHIKGIYSKMEWEWDKQYTEETDDYIYLTSDIESSYSTIYSWEVIEYEVK